MARKRKDLTGQVFDRLTVKEYSHTAPNGVAYWVCECECGNVKIISGNNLKNRTVNSCGCLRKERLQKKTKVNKGGIYPFQANEIKLKTNYKTKRNSKIKTYKLSPSELQEYLKELETKEVQYRKGGE